MSNSWKASLQQVFQSGMTTALGLLQSGKLILRHASDRGATRKVRPGSSHEEILLDGTAQSVRNEGTPRDRSWRPDDINSRGEVKPQQFVMGNEETELEIVSGIKIIRESGE